MKDFLDQQTEDLLKGTVQLTFPFDVYVVGTQECQKSIEKAVVFPSKEKFEGILSDLFKSTHIMIKSETMAALHLAVFVKKEIAFKIHGILLLM
jgi:hypothetical protein